MKKRLLVFLGLFACVGLVFMSGCAVTTSSGSDPATPPSGTTDISVGSAGSATLTAGTDSGSAVLSVVDQDLNAIAGSQYLNVQNVTISIWTTTTATQSATVSSVSYTGGAAGSAISYAMTLDRSTSMSSDDDTSMEAAAAAFVDNMGTSDQGAVVNFSSTVDVDQGLTSNKDLLKYAVTNESTVHNMTALYDSIIVAVGTVSAGSNSRKAVIAMTDGNDTWSSNTLTGCITTAANAGIPVYTVGLGSGLTSSILQQIADDTGGLYYPAPTNAELLDLYNKISSALNSSFTINFTSPVTIVSSTTYYVLITITYEGGITGTLLLTITT